MTKKVILTFPVDATDRPLTYDLIRIYDVKVNILKAEIQPGKTGSLLIEMEADPLRIEQAIAFLNDNGVTDRSSRLETTIQSRKMYCLQVMLKSLPTETFQD